MIRPTTDTPVRIAAALAGAAGLLALAGCSAQTTASEEPATTATAADPSTGSSNAADESATGDTASTYADGTYTATGSYRTPESVEQITVTLTLASDIVTDVEVTGTPTNRESVEYQGKFISGIDDVVVVGKNIADLNVSKVSGSSLTSGGFNDALAKIEAEAKG
ncbi:hypothetical protein [uncultured Microbacterium sp.]|uniref:FMN-binding protein n=1 Tax=uncultured Microbacterium sp. TaxID=191216 RepID=UPI0025EC567E|nr:hypothetical protein [uncultured Microbacterium sp.]